MWALILFPQMIKTTVCNTYRLISWILASFLCLSVTTAWDYEMTTTCHPNEKEMSRVFLLIFHLLWKILLWFLLSFNGYLSSFEKMETWASHRNSKEAIFHYRILSSARAMNICDYGHVFLPVNDLRKWSRHFVNQRMIWSGLWEVRRRRSLSMPYRLLNKSGWR
jgi:hypothetical protein